MFIIFLLINLQLPFTLQSDIETFFSESKCIQEPEDFQAQYLSTYSTGAVQAHPEDFLNYRSEINKLVQYYDLEHSYELVEEKGPTHQRRFNISLILGDEIYHGIGKSKKEAKEMAAELAIKSTSYKKPPEEVKDEDADTNLPPTVKLNNLGSQHGYQIDYHLIDPKLSTLRILNLNKVKEKSILSNLTFWKESAHIDQPPKGPFTVEVTVDQNVFYGKGTTIREAKHDAARKALITLEELGMHEESACTDPDTQNQCKEMKKKMKPTLALVNEYAQKTRLNLEYNELSKTGPSHKPIFEFECILGEWRTVGEGRSKKEAKRNAGKEMLNMIPDLESVQEEIWEERMKNNEEKVGRRKNRKNKKQSTYNMAKELVSNVIGYFSPEDELGDVKPNHKPKGKRKWSPKEKLLQTGNSLNINMQFHTNPREPSGYHSILTLNLNPKYVCLGTGGNERISEEHSALNGLKFLFSLNLLEGVSEEELNIKNFSFDNYIWLAGEDPTSPKQ